MFEYKFMPVPRQVERDGKLHSAPEEMLASLDCVANLLSGNGWEYIRTDKVPLKSRRFFFFPAERRHDVLVFRRAIADTAPRRAEPSAPVRPSVQPRRVQPAGHKRQERVQATGTSGHRSGQIRLAT